MKEEIENLLSCGSSCRAGDEQPGSSLRDYFDVFQCLRGYYLAGINWIPEDLKKAIDKQSSWNPEPCTILYLKTLRFIALIIIHFGSCKEFENLGQQLEDVVDLLEDYILKVNIHLITHEASQSDTSESQKKSFFNLNLWLKIRFGIITSMDLKQEHESCPICMKSIEFTNRKSGKCSSGHQFGRCVNSLLICDFATKKSEKCPKCSRCMFIVPVLWKCSFKCLFCS